MKRNDYDRIPRDKYPPPPMPSWDVLLGYTRGTRHCKADGCTKEADPEMMGYCSPACFMDPNGEGY